MRFRSLVIALLIACLAGSAQADMFTPSHSCRKPIKPYKFTSNLDVSLFQSDVERYKRCISDFVDEQNEEAQNHRQAAADAIDEWNRYVKYELN